MSHSILKLDYNPLDDKALFSIEEQAHDEETVTEDNVTTQKIFTLQNLKVLFIALYRTSPLTEENTLMSIN